MRKGHKQGVYQKTIASYYAQNLMHRNIHGRYTGGIYSTGIKGLEEIRRVGKKSDFPPNWGVVKPVFATEDEIAAEVMNRMYYEEQKEVFNKAVRKKAIELIREIIKKLEHE
jgi:hypothetical protein